MWVDPSNSSSSDRGATRPRMADVRRGRRGVPSATSGLFAAGHSIPPSALTIHYWPHAGQDRGPTMAFTFVMVRDPASSGLTIRGRPALLIRRRGAPELGSVSSESVR